MINPDDPASLQIKKQAKIIDALLKRAERGHVVDGSAYGLFQSAIALQGEVWEKTRDLEKALHTLGRASDDLRVAESARDQTQKNLSDALDAMEGGFALFSDGRLQICNDLFRDLIPDLVKLIEPGLNFETYFKAVAESDLVVLDDQLEKAPRLFSDLWDMSQPATPFVLSLKNDRWFQITHRRTGSGNIVVLQTEITGIVRENRSEKVRLIDEHAHVLQAAFDHMSQGVCTFGPSGHLVIHNAKFGDYLELPYALTHKGTSFQEIFEHIKSNASLVMEDLSELDVWVEELRKTGQLKRRVAHANGRILEVNAHRLPDNGFIFNVSDVTAESQTTEMLEKSVQERTSELMQANEQLRDQRDKQAQVERDLLLATQEAENAVSSKTRFLAAASHDLLQPINAAKLLISTLMERARDSKLADTVDRLDRSFNRTESLLHALLDISRLDSSGAEFSITTFPLDDILNLIKEEYTPLAAERGIQLRVVPSGIFVKSDKRYLLRSIQNLVVNAVEYTPTGRVLVGVRKQGATARVEIWDTGVGISKKDQSRIFAEFTRIEPSASGYGMGLGLSIVERACRHLDHPVSVRSKPGIGSVFTIELPNEGNVDRTALATSEPDSIADESDSLDLIVVLIENDPDVLFATAKKLESWGASVLAAGSTHQALSFIADIGMPPDIILADYQLDDGDTGTNAIQSLRAQTGMHTPAIMITANREENLIAAGRANDFTVLTKPVQLARLRTVIDWKTRSAAELLQDVTYKGLQ